MTSNPKIGTTQANHTDLIYDYSTDIGHRQWVPMYSDSYKFKGAALLFNPSHQYRLWADGQEAVGVNLMGLPPSGRIEFTYNPVHFNPTDDNLVVYMIPVKSPIKSVPIEVGFDKPFDQRNSHSGYRLKFVCKGVANDWKKASIDYDFTEHEGINYVIFAPRINEGCPQPGPGELLITDIKAYTTCSQFPDFWIPNQYADYREAKKILMA